MEQFSIDPTRLRPELPLSIPGVSGSLEGLWRPVPPGRLPRGAVVVAHPLPTQGGSMLNKVVFHVARVLHHDLDLASLRFNFRGTGNSEGAFDEGRGEIDDVLAAWTSARERTPGGLLVAAGFSFGAAVTLLAAAREATVSGSLPDALAVIGLPMERYALPRPFPAPIPIAAVHGEHDQFTPPEVVGEYLENWPGAHAFRVEAGADHFLEGALVSATGFLSHSLRDWL